MHISCKNFGGLLASFFVFVFSLFVFPYYENGDQKVYRAFYEGVRELPLNDAFIFYQTSLGTLEPIYFIFSYILSSFLAKDIALSAANAIFTFLIFKRLLEYRSHPIVIGLASLNFYFIVLLFSAERLKIALLFLLLAVGANGLIRYSLLLVSVLAHVQTMVFLLIFYFNRVFLIIGQLRKEVSGFDFFQQFLAGVGILTLLLVMYDHILTKAQFYYQAEAGVEGAFRTLIFALLSIWYAQKKAEAFTVSLAIVVLSILFGSERLTIFSYLIFMHYSLKFNRGLNIGVIVTSIYFAVKGVVFLGKIFLTGDGFSI
jgi:hypothetical protein